MLCVIKSVEYTLILKKVIQNSTHNMILKNIIIRVRKNNVDSVHKMILLLIRHACQDVQECLIIIFMLVFFV